MKRYHNIRLGGLTFTLDMRHSKLVDRFQDVDEINKVTPELPDSFEDGNKESKAKQEFIADALIDYVNGFSGLHDIFVNKIISEHRTLQQSVFRLMCSLIRAWAKQKTFDSRNEATIKACKAIVDTGLVDGIPYM